jgi:hypothetical protein
MEVWVSACFRLILSFTVNVVNANFAKARNLFLLVQIHLNYVLHVLRSETRSELRQASKLTVVWSQTHRCASIKSSCGVARLRGKARRRPNSRPPNFNNQRQIKSLWCACVAYSVAEADIHFSLRADSSGTYFKAIQDTRLVKLPQRCAPLYTHPVVAMACSSMRVRWLYKHISNIRDDVREP